MADLKRYKVIEAPHSIDHRSPDVVGRRAAYDAAMMLGDRIAVYEWDGRRKHWELIIDRTMPQTDRLQKRAHLRNVLRVVELTPQKREVGTGKPGYRWCSGYLVPTFPSGSLEYPPVSRNEAFARARELFGSDTIVIAR